MEAFVYPAQVYTRRHGPQGYADIDSYRAWLRDEFSFRCVYCLLREQWGAIRGAFGIDHFLPVALNPDAALAYENLLYCCATCNSAKGRERVPDPLTTLTAGTIQVHEDGRIEASTRDARRIIRALGLDDPEHNEWRLLWLGIVRLARQHDPELYGKLMGYPADLPNLARLRPPAGNSRPDGIRLSYHAHREQGTLAKTY